PYYSLLYRSVVWFLYLPCSLPLLQRPPPPTPFPYTTLFRSMLNIAETYQLTDYRRYSGELLALLLEIMRQAWTDRMVYLGDPDGDRKSTRLNSSHVSISYAVFCLKKKKQ